MIAPLRRRMLRAGLLVLGLMAGCSTSDKAPEAQLQAVRRGRAELHVLATAHEGKHLLPGAAGEGGAAHMLGYWREHESQCAPGVACSYLPLSAGDHSSDGVLATQFHGEPVSEALGHMGYAASAIGRSELAFGLPAFARNLERSKVPHLAERAVAAAISGEAGRARMPSLRFERDGLKFAILGISSLNGASADPEQLFKYVNEWALALQDNQIDAGILLSDRCLSELTPAIERGGKNWPYLVLVIGQACGATQIKSPIYSIALLPAGEGMTSYGRAKLTFDRGSRALLQATTSTVDITSSSPTPDPGLQASLAAWNDRRDPGHDPQPSTVPR
jgi:2',3'-cyclic-nucleotide 2'-phosphodiesterase (5'-nucleotidase family)